MVAEYIRWSLTRCLHVYIHIDLLRAAPKQTAPEDKEQYQNNDHEDRDHGNNASASASATILRHEWFLLSNWPFRGDRRTGEAIDVIVNISESPASNNEVKNSSTRGASKK